MTAFHRSAAWQAFTKKVRPIISRALPLPCANAGAAQGCTGVVMPGDTFDISHIRGHDYMLTLNRLPQLHEVGPAHPSCNRSAGAKLAASRRRAKRERENRTPNW